MEEARKLVDDATNTVNEGIHVFGRTLLKSAGVAQGYACEAYKQFIATVDDGKVYVDTAVAHYQAAEDIAVAAAKEGIVWAAANPYISYPVAGTVSILALPLTRRLLYRATLGRFRNPETVFANNASKVEGLTTKVEDYAQQIKKLEERMILAEQELSSGYNKLKATRQELQRLSSSVVKSQHTAHQVIQELRTLKKVENLLEVRAKAADQVSTLKKQRAMVDKYVWRIANKDI